MIRKIKSGTHVSGAFNICQGYSVTLENSARGGTWSSSNTSVATVGTGGVVTGIAIGSAVLSYTLTNSCSTAMATITVNVNPSYSAGPISGLSSMCSGTTATFTHGVGGGVWSTSDSWVADVDAATGMVSAGDLGTATITYTFTEPCGTAVVTFPVTVVDYTYAGVIEGASPICTGSTTTLYDTTALSDEIAGGIWSSGDTSIATIDSSGILTAIAAGTVTMSYTVSNGCGSDFSIAFITINASPDAGAITGTASVCMAATTMLANITAGGVWTSGSAAIATIGSASGIVSGIAVGNASISYSVTNDCGTAVALAIVTVNTLPTAGSITGTASLCPDATITLSNAVSGGSWSSGTASIATVGSGSG